MSISKAFRCGVFLISVFAFTSFIPNDGGKRSLYEKMKIVRSHMRELEQNSGETQNDLYELGCSLQRFIKVKNKNGPTHKCLAWMIRTLQDPLATHGKTIGDFRQILKKIMKQDRHLPHAKKRAKRAAKAIYKIVKGKGLTKKDIYKMALFIERDLTGEILSKGYYHSRIKTRLARTIQVDPVTNSIFIHLKQHKTNAIGQGTNKLVTPSVLYDRKKPQLVAHSENAVTMQNEIDAIKELKGLPGLYKVFAILEKPSKNGSSSSYSFVSKLYSGGDLHHFIMKHGKSLSLKKRLYLAHDIIKGVASMHNKKYAHRDLGLKNYLVDKTGKRPRAVVADFGRATQSGKSHDRGAQGGYTCNAPEGYTCHKLKGDDYLYTDIYAVGCVFYRLLHCKKPCWYSSKLMKNHKIAPEIRQTKLKESIDRYSKRSLKKLGSKKSDLFEKMIIRMINPNPTDRPSAATIEKELSELLK